MHQEELPDQPWLSKQTPTLLANDVSVKSSGCKQLHSAEIPFDDLLARLAEEHGKVCMHLESALAQNSSLRLGAAKPDAFDVPIPCAHAPLPEEHVGCGKLCVKVTYIQVDNGHNDDKHGHARLVIFASIDGETHQNEIPQGSQGVYHHLPQFCFNTAIKHDRNIVVNLKLFSHCDGNMYYLAHKEINVVALKPGQMLRTCEQLEGTCKGTLVVEFSRESLTDCASSVEDQLIPCTWDTFYTSESGKQLQRLMTENHYYQAAVEADSRYSHISNTVQSDSLTLRGFAKEHAKNTGIKSLHAAVVYFDVQPEHPSRPRFPMLHSFVNSHTFDGFCALAIIVNAGLLGAITDWHARQTSSSDVPWFFKTIDKIFSFWFMTEVLLRITATGLCQYLFLSTNSSWNRFDVIVVFGDLGQTCFEIFNGGDGINAQNLTAIRTLRVLRIARTIRLVRLLRFFRELRMMVFSILRSGRTLMWSMIMLGIIIYIFAIFLTQTVTEYIYTTQQAEFSGGLDAADSEVVTQRFGSIIRAGYTLFLAITGGCSWIEVSDPLIEIHWTNGLVFCFFIFFTVFAIMNIITGIFVETAINSAHNDREEQIQEQVFLENSSVKQMQQLFKDIDMNRSGSITFDEFQKHCSDRRMRALLKTVGIEVGEAQSIFRMLDVDNSGQLEIEEFIIGCLRLKGSAKSVDVMILLHEHRRMAKKWMSFMTFVMEEMERQRLAAAQTSSFGKVLIDKGGC